MRIVNMLTVAAFLVLGAIIGWVLATQYTASRNLTLTGAAPGVGGGPVPSEAVSDAKISDFRVQFQTILLEHTDLAGRYMQKIIKNEDPDALRSALDKNAQMLSGIISSVYGGNAGTDFNLLWNDHIEAYADYANAAKNNDANDKISVRNNLIGMASDFEKFMDGVNLMPVDGIGALMQEHSEGILVLADTAASENEDRVLDIEAKNKTQTGRFADYMVEIITREKSELFK